MLSTSGRAPGRPGDRGSASSPLPSEVGVGAIVVGAARRWGERVAFHFRGRDITYRELLGESSRFAHGLIASGVAPGDRVALHLPNLPQFAIAYYGTMLAGATFSPCNPALPEDDLAFQLHDCGATVVVTLDSATSVLTGVLDRSAIRTVVVAGMDQARDPAARASPDPALGDLGVDFADLTAGRSCVPPVTGVDPSAALAHVAYTGGTTGRSKGVMITHRSAVACAVQHACWNSGGAVRLDGYGGLTMDGGAAQEYPIPPGHGVTVNVTPWFHAVGTTAYLNMAVLTGMTQIVHPRLVVPDFLTDMERFSANHLGGAPALFAALAADPDFERRDLSAVRVIASGAAPLPLTMIGRLRARFPDAVICEAYGLTEVTMGVTANPVNRSGIRKPGSVGPPLRDTRIKIVTPELAAVDGSTPCLPTGIEGEVVAHGPQVMAGYLGRREETEDVLSADGWLRTGDIGVLDEDGYLSIVDRKKDVLLYKGYNVYPRELEEILLSHPDVTSAAVVGRPDPGVGELPTAFVVRGGGSTVAELLSFVNTRVVPYKRVRELVVVDAIPVSGAGKTLRRELRARLCR